jgi:hypothetical protein
MCFATMVMLKRFCFERRRAVVRPATPALKRNQNYAERSQVFKINVPYYDDVSLGHNAALLIEE